MSIELNLLRELITAIDAVGTAESTAAEAFKLSYAASLADANAAKAASVAATTRATHTKHAFAAVLSDARAYLATMAPTPKACHG